jgi:hypothetical protein
MYSIVIEYQKLSLRLRRGSSNWDSTLYPLIEGNIEVSKRSSFQALRNRRAIPTKSTLSQSQSSNNLSHNGGEIGDTAFAFDDGITVTSSAANPDHSLAFTTLSTGVGHLAVINYLLQDFNIFVNSIDCLGCFSIL